MGSLDYINTIINEAIGLGIYDVTINLQGYTDTPGTTEVIDLPPLLEKITFSSNNPDIEYGFRIVARELRTKNLTVSLNNVNMNSDKSLAIDLRGLANPIPAYKNIISFSGRNKVVSNDSIGIAVTNYQTIEITGVDSASTLNVNGGIRNPAIGNSEVINFGGHLIFSGEGVVNAVGGDGAPPNDPGLETAIDGAYGIGFAQNTIGSSSIIIRCNIAVNTIGGNGQSCDTGNSNSKTAGNGGSGISLGTGGTLLVEKCINTVIRLTAEGGDGGAVNDTPPGGSMTDIRTGGNGGDAVTAVSGIVDILGTAVLNGGDGTGVDATNSNLPIAGGDGGSAISFTGNTRSSNTLILGDNVKAVGGDGGNSGVALGETFSIESSEGGNGGNVINLGQDPANVSIGSSTLTSGDGGQGGSPKAYVDSGEVDIGALKGFPGADQPGSGGSNGSNIIGSGITNITTSPDIQLNQGITGDGGVGIDNDGNEVQGEAGTPAKEIDLLVKSTPHFGYINIGAIMDFSQYNNAVLYARQTADAPCHYAPIVINNLNIMQTFNNCLNIENVNLQPYYDISTPDLLYGSAGIDLIISSIVTAYVNKGIPVVSEE